MRSMIVSGVSGSRRASVRRWTKPLGASWASPFSRSPSRNREVLSDDSKGKSIQLRNPASVVYYVPSSLRGPVIPTLVLEIPGRGG